MADEANTPSPTTNAAPAPRAPVQSNTAPAPTPAPVPATTASGFKNERTEELRGFIEDALGQFKTLAVKACWNFDRSGNYDKAIEDMKAIREETLGNMIRRMVARARLGDIN